MTAFQAREYELIRVKISDLRFDNDNPNKLTQEQMHGLAESFRKFGYLSPIIIDQNNLIADGEHRALVYKQFNMETIPAYKINLSSDIERRMLRQTMNKLRGTHELSLDAIELETILKANEENLNELSTLIAKDTHELKRIIEEYRPGIQEYKEIGGIAYGTGSLSANWGIPPFSVLDRRTETWQKRRREWIDFGIASEQGREQVVLYGSHLNVRSGPISKDGQPDRNYRPTVSVFDPVIAEVMIRWFCIPESEGRIIDPFSGGSVRGIVSSFFGHEYFGVDLNPEQIEANEIQYTALKNKMPEDHIKPTWIQGDSYKIGEMFGNDQKFDFCITSPPYFHIEHYSDDKNDLNNLDIYTFRERYSRIIDGVAKHMKENTFVAWNVGNARDNSAEGDGFYMNQQDITKQAFENAGFRLYNELILIHPTFSLPFRVNKMFLPKRTIPRQHEYVLVFYNGKKDTIPKVDPRIVNIPEIIEEESQPESNSTNEPVGLDL